MSEYSIDIRSLSEAEWYECLSQFDDATIYQTHAYGAVRWGQDKLSHAVIRRDGEVVGAAQAVIYKIPVIQAGIAYIPWGPLWRKNGSRCIAGNTGGCIWQA